MFDGCVGKESRNARRRRCSTHTHTSTPETRPRRSRRRATKSPHKRRFPSASFTKERGTTSRRSGSAPSNRILGCFFVLVVLPVVESMLGRRTSRVIVFAADGRARREVQPSNHRLKRATRLGGGRRRLAPRARTHTRRSVVIPSNERNVKIHSRDEESCY
jgi:hypothetical protein